MISHKASACFPKSARLLKKRDFVFSAYRKLKTQDFLIVYNNRGSGRIGISIPKKILRNSVQRNRVRRLLREVFRRERGCFGQMDLHVLGQPPLAVRWKNLKYADVATQLKRVSA